jgi:MFS family permease
VASFGALGDRRFRRLLAGEGLSSFGDSALYLTLGIWAKTLTGSNSAAGGVFLALTAPILFAPLAGHLADRVRRKPLLIAVNCATALVVLSLLAVRSRDQLWLIYVVAFWYGGSFNVINAAGAGLRKDMLPGEDLASANAALQTASQGLRVLSPLVGAAIFGAFGGAWVAVLDAVTFAAAIAALVSIKVVESASAPATEKGAFWRDTMAGFRYIRRVPLLLQIAAVGAAAYSVVGIEETTIYAVVGQGLHRPPTFVGVAMSVQGAGAIISGLTGALLLRLVGPARMTGLALACFAIGATAYLTVSLPLVLAGAVLDGLGIVWLVISAGTATQLYTPPELQGRVATAATQLFLAPQTISIAAGAALISVVSYRLLLLVVAVVIAVCAIIILVRPACAPADEPDVEKVSLNLCPTSCSAGRLPSSEGPFRRAIPQQG